MGRVCERCARCSPADGARSSPTGGSDTSGAFGNALRGCNLGRKRSLAVREFALGVEALERFVGREPLYRVHECVFAVLALESDPVDPRL